MTQLPESVTFDALTTIVLDAGIEIMDVYAGDFDVRAKDDASPVTEADERAEKVIIAGLEAIAPEIPIVAEEKAAAGDVPDISEGTFWLVDPLDGTKEFINRRGDFTVNIGLIRDREPVLGIVYAPAKGRLFFGDVNDGAFVRERDDNGNWSDAVPTVVRPVPSGPLNIVASKSHRNPETEAYLALYPGAKTVAAGSSLKFCLVAVGEADLYPRLGPTMEWDTAAGDAVLRAAGGAVLDETGAPFSYAKPDFRNGFFLARGSAELTLHPLNPSS